MDTVTPFPEPDGRGKFLAAKIRRAALEVGIGPDDSLAPLIEALAEIPERQDERDHERARELAARDREQATRDERLIAAQVALLEKGKRITSRPLLTYTQIRDYVLPAILAAFHWFTALLGVLLLVGVFGAGWWWGTPELNCNGVTLNRRPICYRFNGPELPPEPPAPPKLTPGSH